jgi:DNA-binding GntR family transcriptional regulator
MPARSEDRGMATLVQRIELDLRRRLAAEGAGAELRLHLLAARHGCSTRPVRQALERLGESGVLEQDEGGRWRMLRRPRPPAAQAPEAAPEELERRLRDHLIARALAGEDGFLREAATAAAFGVSRARLRDMLGRLAGRALVAHEARRGWRVRTLTQKDFDAFLRVREALERLALDLAIPRLDPARLREFLAGNAEAHGRSDNRLHGYFIALADNPYLSDFFARHAPFFELLFEWEDQDAVAHRDAIRLHRAILAALLAGDYPRAREALGEHIRGSHPMLEDMLARGRRGLTPQHDSARPM